MNRRHAGNRVVLRGAALAPLIQSAEARGVDVDGLLASVGVARVQFEGEGEVALGDYFRLQHQISALVEDETLQLSKRQLLPGSTDFALSQLAHAVSLVDAMRILARSYNILHGGEYNSVQRKGDIVRFVIDDRKFPYAADGADAFIRVSLECIQIFVHCILATLAREQADSALRRVLVRRPMRDDDATHLMFWRAPVRFGASVYALDYDVAAAAAEIPTPATGTLNASAVHRMIIDEAGSTEGAGPGLEMTRFVRHALARGANDQTSVAALAGVSAPTLRRRLEEEGTSFRDLRQDVLNEAAKRLLADRKSLAEVAEELGFSDYRAFSRAFKAWNGVSPMIFGRKNSSLSEKDT